VDPGTPIFLKKILITIHACQANSSVRAKIVKKFIDVYSVHLCIYKFYRLMKLTLYGLKFELSNFKNISLDFYIFSNLSNSYKLY